MLAAQICKASSLASGVAKSRVLEESSGLTAWALPRVWYFKFERGDFKYEMSK
jgi:hypothetical protein